MKNRYLLILLILAVPSAYFAQTTNPLFLKTNILSAAQEVQPFIPEKLFSGNQPVANDPTLPGRIIAALNARYQHDRDYARHGITVSVHIPGQADWSGAIGINDETEPMDTNLVFEIASNTKTFVTALIMKLQDEGKISIKDSLGKWIKKKYPYIDGAITIEQLLNHSSGIYDYLNDDPQYSALEDFYGYNPSMSWTPDSILMRFVGPPNFKAGTSYRYSNTNFILAGMIAELAGGQKLGVLMHTYFIDPLKLTHTFFGGEDQIPLRFAHNWTANDTLNPETDFYDLDKTAQLSGAWAAGNMVSTTYDLVRWVNLLYTGQIISKSGLAQMVAVHRWPDGSYYGLGTGRAPYNTSYLYGHGGSLIGFKSFMWTNPKDSVSIAVYMNSDALGRDANANDYVLDVLGETYRAPTKGVDQTEAGKSLSVSLYPNPAHELANFYFRTETDSHATLRIFNELGEQVAIILNENLSAGIHSVKYDLRDHHSGTYFYRLQSGSASTSGKFVKE
ncbi:MAG: serine hydrolase [Ignavibacteriota bacterium]